MAGAVEVILLDAAGLAEVGELSPQASQVVPALFRRGYRLALVMQPSSGLLAQLKQQRLSGCFELTHLAQADQPGESILAETAQRMGVAPAACAWAASPAGLLERFPARPAPQPETVYAASLSTMYAMDNFPTLADFFEFSRRAGFARCELNHKVTSAMLAEIDLERSAISSVHEPCPADISEVELRRRGWQISAIAETCRAEGVRAVKRSIDLARRAGAHTVVVHAGQAAADEGGLEKQMRALHQAGQERTDLFQALQAQLRQIRAAAAGAGFAALQHSLSELLAYAAPHNICLGIENRYHYLEFPSPDELDVLLGLAGRAQIGFLYDAGHAETLDRLGFYPRALWLERFAAQIVGTHLHDVVGTTDHYAPGLGGVDFPALAACLPETASRTLELQTFNRPEQVKAGVELLARLGCIRTV
jgi:sugar phosphate isomerase/epimerase